MTQEELKKILHYDPETGVFTWLVKPSQIVKSGVRAGSFTPRNYRKISIKRKQFLEHRLAWLYVTGENLDTFLDHINGNPSDNRFSNLRKATTFQNSANQGIRSDNKSGHKGICWNKKLCKWGSSIQYNHKQIHLGVFLTIEEAINSYEEMATRLFGEYKRKIPG